MFATFEEPIKQTMPSSIYRICFTVFTFLGIAAKAQSTSYSDTIQHALEEFRAIALNAPDSCDEEFEKVWDVAVYTKEYHAIAKAYNIRGIGYAYQNDIPAAIVYFHKANQVAERLAPTDILVDARNNIGNMYISQGDSANALKYLTMGLEAAELYGDPDKELLSRIQLTSLQIDYRQYDLSFENLEKIRVHYDHIKELDVKSYYHIARGRYFFETEQYDSALVHARTALDQYSSLQDAIGITTSNYYVGMNLLKLGRTQEALEHCHTSYNVADTSSLAIWQIQSCECLWQAYQKKGEHQKALSYHIKLAELKDQTRNDERTRDLARFETERIFAEARLQDSIAATKYKNQLENDNKIAIEQQKSQSRLLIAGLVFMAIVALLLYRSFRSKKRDNTIILEQKAMVEQKQHEILDSITYAKRLQEAILPSSTQLKKSLPDHFVFYVPKDVVSGDFYWLETISSNSTEKITLLATGDCTGHGVPGALVSVVCSNALSRSVKEFGLKTPAAILDKTSQLVTDTFENDANEVKDGMDAALVAIHHNGNQLSELEFSGAHNPVWIVRQKQTTSAIDPPESAHRLDLIELKADRQPIGKFVNKKPFQNYKIPLLPGDLVYLFTDGFPDQFGGPKGKKLKYQTFKKLILENAHLSMNQQLELLKKNLKAWQAGFEQTDDICVIGVKI